MRRTVQNDVIKGQVIRIISGDIFHIIVTDEHPGNYDEYDETEIIRIVGDAGDITKQELSAELRGKSVTCRIVKRDPYHRLMASVQLN